MCTYVYIYIYVYVYCFCWVLEGFGLSGFNHHWQHLWGTHNEVHGYSTGGKVQIGSPHSWYLTSLKITGCEDDREIVSCLRLRF